MTVKIRQEADDLGGMPRELLLDLLVDAELPEGERATLLRSMDERPGEWRELALRFLQRQVEKETVQALMAGGRLVPVDMTGQKAVAGWVGPRRMVAVAAGLLIAVTSALITLMAVPTGGGARPPEGLAKGTGGGVGASAVEFDARIPAYAMAADGSVRMRVPLVRPGDGAVPVVPAGSEGAAERRSWVIQPDGNGGAVLIPVNTLKAKVY